MHAIHNLQLYKSYYAISFQLTIRAFFGLRNTFVQGKNSICQQVFDVFFLTDESDV